MHPHIIRLYEVIETQTDIYLIMEYVQVGRMALCVWGWNLDVLLLHASPTV